MAGGPKKPGRLPDGRMSEGWMDELGRPRGQVLSFPQPKPIDVADLVMHPDVQEILDERVEEDDESDAVTEETSPSIHSLPFVRMRRKHEEISSNMEACKQVLEGVLLEFDFSLQEVRCVLGELASPPSLVSGGDAFCDLQFYNREIVLPSACGGVHVKSGDLNRRAVLECDGSLDCKLGFAPAHLMAHFIYEPLKIDLPDSVKHEVLRRVKLFADDGSVAMASFYDFLQTDSGFEEVFSFPSMRVRNFDLGIGGREVVGGYCFEMKNKVIELVLSVDDELNAKVFVWPLGKKGEKDKCIYSTFIGTCVGDKELLEVVLQGGVLKKMREMESGLKHFKESLKIERLLMGAWDDVSGFVLSVRKLLNTVGFW